MGHVSETRAWHCKTSLGLASIPQAWPFSGAAHPGGLAWWCHHSHAPHPVTRALPAGQHLWAAGATSTAGMTVRGTESSPSPLSPKSTSQVLHDGFLALLGTCAKHRWLCHDVRVQWDLAAASARGLGAEPAGGLSDGDPLDVAQLLPGVRGLTARVTAGQGCSGQVTQAAAVTLPRGAGTPGPWVHPTLGRAHPGKSSGQSWWPR